MCGRGRSGKTATILALMGHTFTQTESTVGAEDNVVDMRQAQVGGTVWKPHVPPEKEAEAMVAQQIMRLKKEEALKSAESLTSPPTNASGTSGNAKSAAAKTYPEKIRSLVTSVSAEATPSETVDTHVKAPTTAVVNVDNQLVKKLVEESKSGADGDGLPIVVSFLDLGGQEVFYPLHSFFITSMGMFLILFNMEDLLPSVKSEVRAEALEYVRRWINAIVVSCATSSHIRLHLQCFHSP